MVRLSPCSRTPICPFLLLERTYDKWMPDPGRKSHRAGKWAICVELPRFAYFCPASCAICWWSFASSSLLTARSFSDLTKYSQWPTVLARFLSLDTLEFDL